MRATFLFVATFAAAALVGRALPLSDVGDIETLRKKENVNVIIILTDDLGWGDPGYNCHNNSHMCAQTPHLDALARDRHTALFHRFYAAAAVCSPTRAAILTGRTNERDCIYSALPCDNENPANKCSQGAGGALPSSEFTVAKAAKKSKLGDYATIHVGKWHLGDLWDKQLPHMNKKWRVSSPTEAGFDEWHTTQAEASNSMTNCGCFPVDHPEGPGPRPPSGYSNILPTGMNCVLGGGVFTNWSYQCTDYFTPNASDPRKVSGLSDKNSSARLKIPGDDSEFIMNKTFEFLAKRKKDRRPFLAHLCLHSIHEPHPPMPKYYRWYTHDPDYLGAITQMDVQIGRLRDELERLGFADNTVLFFTSDNGPHQGKERSDIRISTSQLRQCKASIFEGGIRVPGLIHWPRGITENRNITMPTVTSDFLPTIMELLGNVKSDNPDWTMDGISLVPYMQKSKSVNRSKPIAISFGGQSGIIDNDWKLITKPAVGQCTKQRGFDFDKKDKYYLFNLKDDMHELHDMKLHRWDVFTDMKRKLNDSLISIQHSQVYETGCKGVADPAFTGPQTQLLLDEN